MAEEDDEALPDLHQLIIIDNEIELINGFLNAAVPFVNQIQAHGHAMLTEAQTQQLIEVSHRLIDFLQALNLGAPFELEGPVQEVVIVIDQFAGPPPEDMDGFIALANVFLGQVLQEGIAVHQPVAFPIAHQLGLLLTNIFAFLVNFGLHPIPPQNAPPPAVHAVN